jgi:hypothetical protein
MQKLRLDMDGLKVETFEPGTKSKAKGTVAGYDSGCSVGYTCGMMSRGEEGFQEYQVTQYACCV